jgi:hypothetical protein
MLTGGNRGNRGMAWLPIRPAATLSPHAPDGGCGQSPHFDPVSSLIASTDPASVEAIRTDTESRSGLFQQPYGVGGGDQDRGGAFFSRLEGA